MDKNNCRIGMCPTPNNCVGCINNQPEFIKPPFGVTPREIHEARRIEALVDAINRRLEAGLKINLEWVEEYNELVCKI